MSGAEKPAILPLNADAIPHDLREIPAWVGYRLVERNGNWTKEPLNIRTGDLGKSDDQRTWSDFQTALAGYSRLGCDGIGLCRTGDLVFGDLDGVLDAAGNLKPYPWAAKILLTMKGQAYI